METHFDSASPTFELLKGYQDGNAEATALLLNRCEQELRRLAAQIIAGERPEHMLRATALLNEAWRKLAGEAQMAFANRQHFVAILAKRMRQILVEEARRDKARKRNNGKHAISLDPSLEVASPDPDPESAYIRKVELLRLDDALTRFFTVDERAARVVELRFFGGLTNKEIGSVLGIGDRQVQREWTYARAWLNHELSAFSG